MNAEEILRSIVEAQPLPYVRGFVIPETLMNEITMLLYNGRRNGNMGEITLKSGDVGAEEMKEEFLQYMVNRRLMGYRKYGSVKGNWDYAANIERRLEKYRETHNTEWLVDVAVYAWLEYMVPLYTDAYFRATEGTESPGSVTKDGHVSQGNQPPPTFHRHEGD